MDEPADPVSYAVEKCLAYAAMHESPAAAAVDFINLLKRGGAMNNSQIAEVSRRVIDKLGERAHQTRFPRDHH